VKKGMLATKKKKKEACVLIRESDASTAGKGGLSNQERIGTYKGMEIASRVNGSGGEIHKRLWEGLETGKEGRGTMLQEGIINLLFRVREERGIERVLGGTIRHRFSLTARRVN